MSAESKEMARDQRIQWRCFHCGDTFTKAQERWAREHFGRDCDAEPVCLIRTAGESALLSALRRAEDDLAEWRAELNPTLHAMEAMAADHRQALIREEEKGYERGLRDGMARGRPNKPHDLHFVREMPA